MKNFFKGFLCAVCLAIVLGLIHLIRLASVDHQDQICDELSCKNPRFVWVDIHPKEPKSSEELQDPVLFQEAKQQNHILVERCAEHYPVRPSRQEEWNIKARIYLQQGHVQKAIETLHQAGKIKLSWRYVGTTLLKDAHFLPEAIQYTQTLLQQEPDKAGLWIELARLQALNQQKKDVHESLKKAFQIQPEYRESVSRLSEFDPYKHDPDWIALLKGN